MTLCGLAMRNLAGAKGSFGLNFEFGFEKKKLKIGDWGHHMA